MKIGLCEEAKHVELAAKLGYDFMELPLCVIAAMPDEEFAKLKETVKKTGIRATHYNIFFPGDMKLVGEEADADVIAEYTDKALKRASELGGKIAVFGSGRARRLPAGFSREKAMEQIKAAARILAEKAEKYGMLIALEPLNSKEADLITSVEEGYHFVKEINAPSFRLLVDFFHMLVEDEPIECIGNFGDEIIHCHISIGEDRHYPGAEDSKIMQEYLDQLNSFGYKGGLSIEAITKDIENDAKKSIDFLRSFC